MLHNKGMWENMYTMKRIISSNGKERIIIILCNVQNKDDCQSKEKIINIEKRREEYLQVENLCMTCYIYYGAQK